MRGDQETTPRQPVSVTPPRHPEVSVATWCAERVMRCSRAQVVLVMSAVCGARGVLLRTACTLVGKHVMNSAAVDSTTEYCCDCLRWSVSWEGDGWG